MTRPMPQVSSPVSSRRVVDLGLFDEDALQGFVFVGS